MEIISSKNIINIIRKTLNLIDPRLIEHGERVAYMLCKMLQEDGGYNEEDILSFTMAGLFHDIGAYKIEEIDNLVDFETDTPINHSIYGYLYYKYLTPLDEIAKIVLYHHLEFYKLQKLNFKYEAITSYITLVDKIDVIANIAKKDEELYNTFVNKDGKFSEDAIKLFLHVNKKYQILDKLKDGTYQEDWTDIIDNADFTINKIEMYIKMLIYSIDFRSEYTVMHTITTVEFADEIGQRMGLSKLEQKQLHFGALFHDLGKITTPVSILEATRKLTEDEMHVMRNHVSMSEYILKDYIDPTILRIAIRHHEKMDGTGYPYKIKGELLTIPERVLAVADIVSALAGKRSYKESYNEEKIKSILWHNMITGKLCDKVVQCTIDNFEIINQAVKDKTSKSLETYSKINEKYNEIYKTITELHEKNNIY